MTGPAPVRALALGIEPGAAHPAAHAAGTLLSLDPATGSIGVARPAATMQKTALRAFLETDPVFSIPDLRLVCLAAPLTPQPIDRKPLKARAVEIRLSRGAFSSSQRGPGMPWIANPRSWPRYVQAVPLQEALGARGFPLLSLPTDPVRAELPCRCTAEVFPKASLALLISHQLLQSRPHAGESLGQLDDWLFPRLFTELVASPPPIVACLRTLSPGLHLAPETFQEAQRIANIRRPFSRREPLRAFVAALQGILALRGAACLVGASGDTEGSLLLPATWHPDWEAEWSVDRRSPSVRRLPVASV